MECGQCFPSQPFVVLTGARLNDRNRIATLSKNWHISSNFSEKSESPLHKRRSLIKVWNS